MSASPLCVKPGPYALKGRGTSLNPTNRFDAAHIDAFDDGWDNQEEEEAKPRTSLIKDTTRSIISRNDSPDLSFGRSINPYRGCEHGCIYCFARPSHAYLGFSAGLDFETKIIFKPEAPKLLEKELSQPNYNPAVIFLGSNTDPYQPVERTLGITRDILEVLERFHHPVGIITKSANVLRDSDILSRMSAKGLARVHISITTLIPGLARAMEPRASSAKRRLATISTLTQAGIPTGIMASPMIPGLNDTELESILENAALFGASTAAMGLLRLPYEVSDLFKNWLEQYMPDRATHILSLIRQTRSGELNNSSFHKRFQGDGPYAALLSQRFKKAAKRLGLHEIKEDFDLSQFRATGRTSAALQMNLF